jgi:hypothetical protein
MGTAIYPAIGTNLGIRTFLKDRLRINCRVVNNDDLEITWMPKTFLEIGHLLDISAEDANLSSVADELIRAVSPLIQAHSEKKRVVPQYPLLFGKSTEIENLSMQFQLLDTDKYKPIIVGKLIPYFKSWDATKSYAIKLDADAAGWALAITKHLYLASNPNTAPNHQELVQQKNVLARILPSHNTVLGIIECLSVSAPSVFAFPFSAPGCLWLFTKEDGWQFRSDALDGFVDRFRSSHSPITGLMGFQRPLHLEFPRPDDQWSFTREFIYRLNAFWNYFLDPTNFVDGNNVIEPIAHIQNLSAVSLLIADWKLISFSTDSHQNAMLSFSIIDKLANLKARHLGLDEKAERILAQEMFSLRFGELLRRKLETITTTCSTGAKKVLSQECWRLYCNLHLAIANKLGAIGHIENHRTQRLMQQRHLLAHGTFLTRDRFQSLFLNDDGELPVEASEIAKLLMIAFIADPKAFLSFRI